MQEQSKLKLHAFDLAGIDATSVFILTLSLGTLAACSNGRVAQQPGPSIPQEDSSYIDAQGTAHITRVIPLPKTISPQAGEYLARPLLGLRT